MWFFNDRKSTPHDALRQNRRAALFIAVGILLLLCAVFLDFPRYRILTAAPDMRDSNFAHSVVLVARHGLATHGVILNRALSAEQSAQLPSALRDHIANFGGPVGFPDTVTVLLWKAVPQGEPRYGFRQWEAAALPDAAALTQRLTALQAEGYQVRVFAGYAGWVPLQLEMELWLARVWRVYQPAQMSARFSSLLDGSGADWNALQQLR